MRFKDKGLILFIELLSVLNDTISLPAFELYHHYVWAVVYSVYFQNMILLGNYRKSSKFAFQQKEFVLYFSPQCMLLTSLHPVYIVRETSLLSMYIECRMTTNSLDFSSYPWKQLWGSGALSCQLLVSHCNIKLCMSLPDQSIVGT